MSREYKKKLLLISFCVSFLYSLHASITLYVNSIFLETLFSRLEIATLYTGGGIFAIIFSFYISRMIRRAHNYRATCALLVAEIASLLLLAYSTNPYIIVASFILHIGLVAALLITINLFIEEFEDDNEIGVTRGIFITLTAISTIVSALLAGALIRIFGFEGIYVGSAIILSPVLLLLYHYYKNVAEPKYKSIDLRQGLREIFEDKNIYGVFVATFALQVFYVIMTIYCGIYMLQQGLTLQTILTFVIPIALVPFIILPYELGKLADIKTGEKELLITGMIIMGVVCILLTFMQSSSPVFWAFILFLSRIGAATTEEMSNSYFYKKAKKTDSVLLGMFGSLYNLAMVFAPICAAIILVMFDINFIFFFLGIFILLSIFPVLKIIDTK